MLVAVLVMLVGLISLIAAWVLPLISDHLPARIPIALLVGGLALTLGGALLGISAERQKHEHHIAR